MFGSLSNEQIKMLRKIRPSRDRNLLYYPCDVVTCSNSMVDCVYIVQANEYYSLWGVWPADDQAKRELRIEDVKMIKESSCRLPVKFAKKLYEAGESGMGYIIFTIQFRTLRQAYVAGNAIDFIYYPEGLNSEDIVDVLPHEGRNDENLIRCPEYYWCLFEGEMP